MIKRTKIYRGGAKAAPKPKKKSIFKRLASIFSTKTKGKAKNSGSDPGPTKKKEPEPVVEKVPVPEPIKEAPVAPSAPKTEIVNGPPKAVKETASPAAITAEKQKADNATAKAKGEPVPKRSPNMEGTKAVVTGAAIFGARVLSSMWVATKTGLGSIFPF
jgi:hypothetical protein